MKITPRFPGDITLMAIGYKYNSWEVLGFIATKGAGITDSGHPYLSHYPDTHSNVFIFPNVLPHILGRYLDDCNVIGNNNKMRQYDIELDKYWVTQSGYFRLATTVALGMGIKNTKPLFFHGISEQSRDKKITLRN